MRVWRKARRWSRPCVSSDGGCGRCSSKAGRDDRRHGAVGGGSNVVFLEQEVEHGNRSSVQDERGVRQGGGESGLRRTDVLLLFGGLPQGVYRRAAEDRKSTRLNSSHI